MIKKKTLITLLIFFAFTNFYSFSQEVKYLQQVGIADSIYSEVLKESRTFYVEYPIGFNEEDDKKYPVAYILDGELLLPTVQNVQNYYSGGYTPEMILIGIDNAINRTRDLTTSEVVEMYGMPATETTGGASKFLAFIKSELIPFVEEKYPVTDYRTLIGHSYGGLFTVHTLLNDSNLFKNYLAIDPSLEWDNQQVIKEAAAKISETSFDNESVFISLSGQLHMQKTDVTIEDVTIENVMNDTTDFTLFSRSIISFSDLLKNNKQIKTEFKFYPNDLHGTIPLPSIMDGLISCFEWYQMENIEKFNSPSTKEKELRNIIRYRAEKLGNHFGYKVPPYPEELLNVLGYMSMDMEQFSKAKMFFEFAIEFYPKSPNTYDSMADYYERNNVLGMALQNVERANELSPSTYYAERILSLKQRISEKKKSK
ncbi:alpha/beta hydrolase-fold protein [Sediminitomix flava]|uniref:Uncharacterized protein n=1 Tax=Sediminitomix flava TaxID=379075 RepID=A0A315ZCD8_SEDFL|nr:alpha/beta hydrolase-fold protein [Sediminitomix flava]PWJ42404.1 hypothetical protein BC781_103656 [Sediminitomix flava]